MYRALRTPAGGLRSRLSKAGWHRTYASEASQYDLVVVGGGPGGYVAAIKASQLGLKTACIEKRKTLGGTCLNVGCIPSKSLLNNSHLYHVAQHEFSKRGIKADNLAVDLTTMLKAKQKSVESLTNGVQFLFKKNGVEYIQGHGTFTGNGKQLKVEGEAPRLVDAKHVIVATGSEPSPFPGIEIDEKTIVTSTGVLELEKIPRKLIVMGGGVIGLELGSVWSRLGAEVTVVEYMGSIGAGMDADVAKAFQRILSKQGIKFKLNTKVTKVEKKKGNFPLAVHVEGAKGGKEEKLDSDILLVSIGRRPYTDSLGLDSVGVKVDAKSKRILVNEHFQTGTPGIYAIGDVCDKGPMLAHKAEEEGIACVERIATGYGHVNYGAIPSVVYTHPEVAWVGKTEAEVKAAGIEYKTGSFPMTANSRAKTIDDADGMIKIISDAKTDRILGGHIIGTGAGELVAELVLGIEYGASSEDIARTSHAHPTFSEAVKEACMATYDKPIHA